MPFLHRRTACVLAFVLLTGCASSYSPPANTSTARIRLVAPQATLFSGNMKAMIYPSETCQDPMTLAILGGIERQLTSAPPLGMPSKDQFAEHTTAERVIPAARRSLFSIRAMVPYGRCAISFSFLPETGADYEARVTWDTTGCKVGVQRIRMDSTATAFLTREVSMRREPTCLKGFW